MDVGRRKEGGGEEVAAFLEAADFIHPLLDKSIGRTMGNLLSARIRAISASRSCSIDAEGSVGESMVVAVPCLFTASNR